MVIALKSRVYLVFLSLIVLTMNVNCRLEMNWRNDLCIRGQLTQCTFLACTFCFPIHTIWYSDGNYALVFFTNNMNEKITRFWLAESSAVKVKHLAKKVQYTCAKSVIQCKLHIEILDYDWLMNNRIWSGPIKSFAFKSSARPGWHNLWRNFSLIA